MTTKLRAFIVDLLVVSDIAAAPAMHAQRISPDMNAKGNDF
jgi:archaellum component FlaG (FlaF/FlaG flagellin family)